MNEIFDNQVKACMHCVENMPMKPALSRVSKERASRPFEIITLDYAEFKKKGESFVVIGDKYSGALHVAGVKKGVNTREKINAVTDF